MTQDQPRVPCSEAGVGSTVRSNQLGLTQAGRKERLHSRAWSKCLSTICVVPERGGLEKV